jgi:hypothetical protein
MMNGGKGRGKSKGRRKLATWCCLLPAGKEHPVSKTSTLVPSGKEWLEGKTEVGDMVSSIARRE